MSRLQHHHFEIWLEHARDVNFLKTLFLVSYPWLCISAAAWIQSDNADCVFERRHQLVVNGYTGLSLKMHLSPTCLEIVCLHLQLSFSCCSLSANLLVYSESKVAVWCVLLRTHRRAKTC